MIFSGFDAPGAIRNRPVLVLMNSVESAGLTVRAPTIGVSPSGSTHGTARSAAGSPPAGRVPVPAAPRERGGDDRDEHQPLHEGQDGTCAARTITRTSTRASATSSSTDTHSSTACARSIPVVPGHRARDAARGEQAHVGAPRHADGARRRAALVRDRAGHDAHPRVVRGRLGGQERAAGPVDLGGRLAVVERARDRVLERRPARPPASAPTGTPTRPSTSTRSGTWLDHSPPATRPTSSGYGSSSPRISGCATPALICRSSACQRRVHAHVAVDRRAAFEPVRGVRGAAGHHAPEGERARLRADDVEAGRLGDQRRVERRVALQLRERPEPAVLLRGDALQHHLRRRLGDRAHRRQRVQLRPPPRPSCRPRRDRAAGRPRRRPTTGPCRHGAVPGPTTSTCPFRHSRRGAPPASVAVRPHSSSRARLLAGVVRDARAGRRGRARAGRPPGRAPAASSASASSTGRSSPVTLGIRRIAAASRASAPGSTAVERGSLHVHRRHATWPIGVVLVPPPTGPPRPSVGEL